MYLSCHRFVLSQIWVNVKENVQIMNPIPVTYFGDNACLTGVPLSSSNFRVTFHSVRVCDLTNTQVSVFRCFKFTVLYYR